MDKATKNNLIIGIRQLKRIIKHGEQVKTDASAKRAMLNNDHDHTAKWKEPQYAAITQLENNQYRELGESARSIIEIMVNALDSAQNDFDFTDPELQTAVSTVERMGKNLPFSVRKQIAERFRGNPTALDMLLPLYKKNGFSTDDITSMKSLFQSSVRYDHVIGEFLGYACSDLVEHNEWRAAGINQMITDFERGLGLDTSVNPYVKEIDDIFNASKSREQRRTITVYRRRYGEKLNNDDPEAMEEASRLIENDFTGPVV